MIWRPGLFFITIVSVTSSGRVAVVDYANQIITRLDAQAPYSHAALAFIALTAFACLLTLCDFRRKKRDVYMVCQEIHYGIEQAPADPSARSQAASTNRTWRTRLRQIWKNARRVMCVELLAHFTA
jgi:hypothetical protein